MTEGILHHFLEDYLPLVLQLLLTSLPTAGSFVGGYILGRLILSTPRKVEPFIHLFCTTSLYLLESQHILNSYANKSVLVVAGAFYGIGLVAPRALDLIRARWKLDKERDFSLFFLRMSVVAVVAILVWLQPYFLWSRWVNILVALKWKHQAQFAGFYVANELGFYRDANIRVAFVEGGFEEPRYPVRLVLTNEPPDESDFDHGGVHGGAHLTLPTFDATFGVTGALDVIRARSISGYAIKAVAVIFNKSPACWFGIPTVDLRSPDALLGQTVGLSQSYLNSVDWEYEMWLREGGVSYAEARVSLKTRRECEQKKKKSVFNGAIIEVELPQADLGNLALFGSSINIWTGYRFNEYLKASKKYNQPLPVQGSAGPMYGDVIIAHDAVVHERPEVVRAFVAATMRGWEHAIEPANAQEVLAIVERARGSSDPTEREHQLAMLTELRSFVLSDSSKKIGLMDDGVWAAMSERASKYGFGAKVEPKMLFTNEFVGAGDDHPAGH